MQTQRNHTPVLPQAVVELASVGAGQTVVDGTFGAGGHARLLAAELQPGGTLIGIDRDPSIGALFERFSAEHPGIQSRFMADTFPHALRTLAQESVSAQAVILDIGVSSMQLDQRERGFAYSYDAPLDMRMDPASGIGAAELLNTAPQEELERILREYGEERFARRIARAVIERREAQPLARTEELVELLRKAIPGSARERGGHPAKRTFQALRIAVNDELGMLDTGLDAALEVLAPGGRLLVISFHSLEDRMVKRRFEAWARDCVCPPDFPVCRCETVPKARIVTRRLVEASLEEAAANPRAASAKLRVAERLDETGGLAA